MRDSAQPLKLAIPAGHMYEQVEQLAAEAGLHLEGAARSYRPRLSVPGFEVKLLKPQNIVEMLHAGTRDVGFTGADWVEELDGDLVEVLDTGLDPVRLVAAVPSILLDNGSLPRRPLVVASEYETLTRRWIEERGLEAEFVHSYGATEVFPPEDADVIVDNTATGSTLRANDLTVIDELMTSSTRLYASPEAWKDSGRRGVIEELRLLLASVLEARRRVMLELNVEAERLEGLLEVLPCMRKPTVSSLAGDGGYAVRAAVPAESLPRLIPRLKELGGSDLVVTRLAQIVP